MKKPVMLLVVATLVATTTPILAQAPAGQPDRALMPGSTSSPPPLTGGNPNSHEGHASTTCAKGPNADEKNAARPECPQMDSVIPRGVTANNGMATGAPRSGEVGYPTNTPGR
jgi:hypothetical protein